MFAILAVIAFMVLLVIYFFVRSQSVEKELKVQKSQSKSSENQAKNALMSTASIVTELQKMLISRLEAAKRRNLVAGKQYDAAKTVYENMDKIVMQCCERGSTVSEACDKTFANTSPNIEEIKTFISEQPNDVRMQWTRNTVNSFISACVKIIDIIEKPGAAKPTKEPASAPVAEQTQS